MKSLYWLKNNNYNPSVLAVGWVNGCWIVDRGQDDTKLDIEDYGELKLALNRDPILITSSKLEKYPLIRERSK